MKLARRQFGKLTLATLAAAATVAPSGGTFAAATDEPELGANGLYVQDWFLDSFLDLKEDFAEAASEGKNLAVMWEQEGCPYCREMHRVNLAHDDIRSYIQQNFTIVQLDMWGAREVTDFDGEAGEERAMARKWNVNFTPTIMFFPHELADVEGKTALQAEVIRMPGYFKPFHFVSMFEYVRDRHYETQGFQRFVHDRFQKLKAEGKDPDIW